VILNTTRAQLLTTYKVFSGHPPSGVSCPPAVLRPSPQNRSPDNEKSSQTIRLLFSNQADIRNPLRYLLITE
ncbi:MAG: hypothetical protein PUF29_14935, partial [Anaerobutyricum hallii]|uniref:hypothetical protein n=1 Tax=Anaerobutyricum hallii TaxID=39488 RepID=UPI00242FE8DE